MQARRRWIAAAGAAALAGVFAPPAAAQATPRDGRDFRLVKPQQATEAPAGKIEVIEFFWYGCPHCNALEPVIKEWVAKLPADVAFRRVHVPFGDRRHQQLFYTLEAMGKADALGDKVFHAIHVDRDRLDTVDRMTAMLSRHGVDRKQFTDTFESFAVRTKMRRATQVSEAYGVDGVPAMAVNGKYYTSPSMAGSNQAALRVMDALIAQERQARK
ncbi:MAG TPA: thiol:disulfide interchange protein DsbA/DsbL [Burkholderiaceae bacterium]|nr:thiol:disulfide interchange protein DsbA/DsbL [Burkholderiaceae bacterium]HRA78966.1 thiol:disulfide interchange protein DsbA/DsbL [Burkholderiaceae bacterium]